MKRHTMTSRSTRAGRIVRGVAGAAAVASILSAPAWPASLRPVNLEEMSLQADRIVVGRAVSEWSGRDRHGLPATVTIFEISRVLKGGPWERLAVKQLGVTRVQPDGLAAWIEGMPRYRQGSEYLLFLAPDSALGFTMPVGAFQGVFEVRPAGPGRKAAVNGIDNANLLRGLPPEDLARRGLPPDAFPFVSRGRGPIDLEEIGDLIGRLAGARGAGR